MPRRPILIWCDIGHAAALASIPIASAAGVLTYAQLVAVVFVTGSLTVFFDVAYQSILPALVDREQLTDGNAKLEISRSGAQLAGPGIGGLLVQWVGAASAVTADAVSFVASALLHPRDPGPGASGRVSVDEEPDACARWATRFARDCATCSVTGCCA